MFSHDRWGYAAYQQALAGDPDGLFYTGMCFETGMGLARSAEAALGHYEKALELGYPGAREAVERCKRKRAWKEETKSESAKNEEKPWWMS
ncbi:MAG: hypothetical protein OXE59_00725 [Bacteroidetes bacterium]|nr:hypothetical protein [Bacteroidota bacterium]